MFGGSVSFTRLLNRLLKQVLYSQLTFGHRKRGRPSSPVQGYHQEKPEAERHKDPTHGHHSRSRDINGEQ